MNLEQSICNDRSFHTQVVKLSSQQYRAWSDCTGVQAGWALYWWPIFTRQYCCILKGQQSLYSFMQCHPRLPNLLNELYYLLALVMKV